MVFGLIILLIFTKILFFFLCKFDTAEIIYSMYINKHLITLINKDNNHNYIQDFIYTLPLFKKRYTIFSNRSKYIIFKYFKDINIKYMSNYKYSFINLNNNKSIYFKRLDNTFFYYYKSTQYMNFFKTYGVLIKKHKTLEKNITFKIIHKVAGIVLTQSINKFTINSNISNL